MQCREPSVQHLTDSTFEHLTQVIIHDNNDNYDSDDDDHDNDNFRPPLEQPLGIGLSYSSLTSARRAGMHALLTHTYMEQLKIDAVKNYKWSKLYFHFLLSGEWRPALTALPAN